MKMKIYLLVGFIIGSFLSADAQREKKEYDFLTFGLPQYLLSNGIRLDFDIRQKGTAKWIVLSPYYYYDHESVDPLNLGGADYYFDPYTYGKMVGVGLGIGQKIFLSKEPVSKGFYLYYGAAYKYFNIQGENYNYVSYIGPDGLDYQHMEFLKYSLNIHSVFMCATIGYQFQIMPSLYIDPYIGFGIKYSFHQSPQNVTLKYNRGVDDYGYTGTLLVGGIRIGIGI